MVKRKCPVCGNVWFCCVEQESWNCQNCGYLLTIDLNEVIRMRREDGVFSPGLMKVLFPDNHESHACADKLHKDKAIGGFSYFTPEELETKCKALDDLYKLINDLAKALAEWASKVSAINEEVGEWQ